MYQDDKVAQENEDQDSARPDKRSKVGYWLKWVKGAKKGALRHWDDGRDAYAQSELPESSRAKSSDEPKKGYHIYPEACWTLEPAYYSNTPTIVE